MVEVLDLQRDIRTLFSEIEELNSKFQRIEAKIGWASSFKRGTTVSLLNLWFYYDKNPPQSSSQKWLDSLFKITGIIEDVYNPDKPFFWVSPVDENDPELWPVRVALDSIVPVRESDRKNKSEQQIKELQAKVKSLEAALQALTKPAPNKEASKPAAPTAPIKEDSPIVYINKDSRRVGDWVIVSQTDKMLTISESTSGKTRTIEADVFNRNYKVK